MYINSAADAGYLASPGYHDNRTKFVESSLMKGCDRQAHMDDVDEVRRQVYGGRDGEQANTSTFWLRKLEAAESADPNRLTMVALCNRADHICFHPVVCSFFFFPFLA